MRKLYFLLPGTDGKFICGGLFAELKTLSIAQTFCDAEVVTYRQRENNKFFLDDVIKQHNLDDVIFVMSWGFDIASLAPKLKSYNVIYHAHSAGYGFKLPPSIPIITVSRNTMGYWGQLSPNSLIYYLPNQISDEFTNLNINRDIDVLVQSRKSSQYLMRHLAPALQKQCNVFIVESFVKDLPSLFNRTRVYLYDSAEYWALQKVSEGFGLQPLEAMACGCHVFSSLNSGLSDFLDPGFNCYKIAGYSKEYDIQRILKVVANSQPFNLSENFLAQYRLENITNRFQVILDEINQFFDHKQHHPSNIPDYSNFRLGKLKIEQTLRRVRGAIKNLK